MKSLLILSALIFSSCNIEEILQSDNYQFNQESAKLFECNQKDLEKFNRRIVRELNGFKIEEDTFFYLFEMAKQIRDKCDIVKNKKMQSCFADELEDVTSLDEPVAFLQNSIFGNQKVVELEEQNLSSKTDGAGYSKEKAIVTNLKRRIPYDMAMNKLFPNQSNPRNQNSQEITPEMQYIFNLLQDAEKDTKLKVMGVINAFSIDSTVEYKGNINTSYYYSKLNDYSKLKDKIQCMVNNLEPEQLDKEEGECHQLQHHETKENKINIVIVPSGFGDDMESFKAKAQSIYEEFDKYVHLKKDNELLNVFYVTTNETNESYCQYGLGDLSRSYFIVCNPLKTKKLANNCTPNSKILVVHNNERFGGSGIPGLMATTSLVPGYEKIAAHEINHSIFHLGDEYPESDINGQPVLFANCSLDNKCVRWKDLIDLGMEGASCTPKSCAKGEYFASTPFSNMLGQGIIEMGPANERFICCRYIDETGSYPKSFCDKFNKNGLNLRNYCNSPLNFSLSNVMNEVIEDIYEMVEGIGTCQLKHSHAH